MATAKLEGASRRDMSNLIYAGLRERDPEKDVDEREQQESPTLPPSAPAGDLPLVVRHRRSLWIGRPHEAGRLRVDDALAEQWQRRAAAAVVATSD
jgi:hypothetical protein